MSLKNSVLGFFIFLCINLAAYNVSFAEDVPAANTPNENKVAEETDGLQPIG